MKLREICETDTLLNLIMETGTSGGTSTGSIASVPISTGLMIRRMPTEPNLFGYIQPVKRKSKKKRRKKR